MRARATADLCQLGDGDFFRELSNGMRAVVESARSLIADARLLADAKRPQSSTLLMAIAEEEAAKYLILLDSARCERHGPNLARQLARFNDHLAKGLYAQYAAIAPGSFGEVLEFLELERRLLYLDGPNDIDWIFRNRILREREEAIYVDYVESEGRHEWVEPHRTAPSDLPFSAPESFTLSVLLSEAGFDTPDALALIAEEWRGVSFAANSHWQECHLRNLQTLARLSGARLLTESGEAKAAEIAWDWLFPLHSVDLTPIRVDRRELEDLRRHRLANANARRRRAH